MTDNEIHVISVEVNRIPQNCGECPLMSYERYDDAVCTALPRDKREIAGNPYDMTYRRSDCPLIVVEE